MGGLFGLFSSKKVVTVNTVAQRVIEDELIPTSIKTGVTKAIFKEGEITDYVMEELVNSIGLRADRMYEYAQDNYTHGLPSGSYVTSRAGNSELVDILSAIEGVPVEIGYSNYGPANSMHIAWMKVNADYGYNLETNKLSVLSAIKGTDVYLDDLQIVIPSSQSGKINPFSLEQWGDAPKGGYTPRKPLGGLKGLSLPTLTILDPNASEDYIRLKYVWVVNEMVGGKITPVTKYEHIDLSIQDYDEQDRFFHVQYIVNNQTKYWIYKDGSGTYPELEALFNKEPELGGTFFPMAYFRYNKQSEVTDTNTDAYKTTKKMLKYLNIDYASMGEAVNDNPDIANVEQAILLMGVPAVTTNQIEKRYLFDFFNSIYIASGSTQKIPSVTASKDLLSADISKEKVAIIIQDKKFKMALTSDSIYKRRKVGNLGKIGFCTSEFVVRQSNQNYEDFEGNVSTQIVEASGHYYRKQVSLTMYEEIFVPNLQMTYYIDGQHTVTADEEDPILIIPIDRSISNLYSLPDKEELYARSLHYVFNSKVVTTIKWYQTGAFKILLVIAAIVITIISQGTGWQSIGAALAAGQFVAAAVTLITIIIEQLIISYLFKLFIKVVGIKVAFIIAIVAAVAGTYVSIDAGSVAGAPWAKELLSISTGLSNAASELLAVDFNDLLKEATEFSKFVEEQTKTLEKAQELLNPTKAMSPFIIFGETPDKYYNRTIHAGNIGTVGIDAIENYVAASLTLPKINETLQEA